ncbi:putative ribonuclease H-like domain-containing protein [Tanacetum coccineum]
MVDRGIFDSGCSGHMIGNKDQPGDFEEFNGGSVTFGGSKGYISGKGRIRVGNLDFDSVSFVKELGHFNLFSISQICDKQHKVLFTETECLVVSSDFKMPDENQILLKVPRHHNMYSFDMKTPSPAKGFACLIAKATSDESKLWHRRLGHINFKNLNKLVKGNLVRGLPSKVFKNDHTCVACHKGKQHRASCKAKLERLITVPLHTLHMDLFGPTSVKSINHASYCLVITDDCTRFSWVFFLASKDETSGILQTFIRQIENQLSHRVKIIRSDNGTEFKNRDMLEFCGNKGIKQEYSTARTPQQNGVAERMNRTLIEAARTMLADSLLPTTFWAEAVSTACYIFNRVRVTKPQNKTPYELLFGHKPIISYIRPFGCHVTILDTLSVLGKFDGKSDEGFLVGYSLNSKAYRVYNLVTKRVEVNLHVNFLEDKPNVKGVGYRWMFDIDYLTDSMNYIPVSLENQANPHAGASEVTNSAGTPTSIASEEKDEEVELIVVPSAVKIPEEKDESRTSSTNSKKEETLTEPQKEKKDSSTDSLEDNPKIQAFRRELEEIALKHLGTVPENNTTSTPSVNTGSQTVNTGRLDHDDSLMPELEIFHKPETGIFDEASYDEEGVITDFNSLPTEIEVSPTPTLRIHSIHPKSQILGDPKSAVQTRSKVQNKSGAHALLSHIQKQQRNNHKDQQHCLFACFLSQEEPKKIVEALQDDSWVQAMQEELLQFKLQRVWVLVDLPHGMKIAIRCKRFMFTKNPGLFDPDTLRRISSQTEQGESSYLKTSSAGDTYDILSMIDFHISMNVTRIFKYLKGNQFGLYGILRIPFDLEDSLIVIMVGQNLDSHGATSTTEAEYVSCCKLLWIWIRKLHLSLTLKPSSSVMLLLPSNGTGLMTLEEESSSGTKQSFGKAILPLVEIMLKGEFLDLDPVVSLLQELCYSLKSPSRSLSMFRGGQVEDIKPFNFRCCCNLKQKLKKIKSVYIKDKKIQEKEGFKESAGAGLDFERERRKGLYDIWKKKLKLLKRQKNKLLREAGLVKQSGGEGYKKDKECKPTRSTGKEEKTGDKQAIKYPVVLANYKIIRKENKVLYRICDEIYMVMNEPEDEFEKYFGNIEELFEEPPSTDSIWSLGSVQSNVGQETSKAGNPDEDCYKLLKMMEEQLHVGSNRRHMDGYVRDEQMTLVKTYSNPLMAGQFAKIVMGINYHIWVQGLTQPEQTVYRTCTFLVAKGLATLELMANWKLKWKNHWKKMKFTSEDSDKSNLIVCVEDDVVEVEVNLFSSNEWLLLLWEVLFLMARIQHAKTDSDERPSNESTFIIKVQTPSTSFMNPLFSKSNHEQTYHEQPKIINFTNGDEQIISEIIFDDPNIEVNDGSIEHDKSAHDSCDNELEQLARNV